MDTRTGEERRLAAPNEDFLAEMELCRAGIVLGRDLRRLEGACVDDEAAMDVAGDKVPTIVEVHGGPHTMYANSFVHEFQLLVAQGYAVLYTNPRGSQATDRNSSMLAAETMAGRITRTLWRR